MYAIVRQGGKQYRVAAGEELVCDRVRGEIGQPFMFEKHLLISDQGKTVITDAGLAKYAISAELVEHFDDKKVVVFKYKAKKGYRRNRGHRQPKSRLKILAIEKAKDASKTKTATAEKKPVAKKTEAAATKATAAKKATSTTKTVAAKKPAVKKKSEETKKD